MSLVVWWSVRKCGRFEYVGGLVNWSSMFVEAIFETSFCFSYRELRNGRLLQDEVVWSLHVSRRCPIQFRDFNISETRRLQNAAGSKFLRDDILHMLTPSSWWPHVALRTWVWEFWRSVQNVSILLPVLKWNDGMLLYTWKFRNLGSLDGIYATFQIAEMGGFGFFFLTFFLVSPNLGDHEPHHRNFCPQPMEESNNDTITTNHLTKTRNRSRE